MSDARESKSELKEASEREGEPSDERVRIGRDGTIQLRASGSRSWQTVTLGRLARAYDATHPIWDRLRARGFTRPSPSGPTVPEDRRERVHCALRLRPEDVARLDAAAAAWGVTRSEAVLRLLAQAVPTPQVPVTTSEKR